MSCGKCSEVRSIAGTKLGTSIVSGVRDPDIRSVESHTCRGHAHREGAQVRPSSARSLITVLSKVFATQMLAPSNAMLVAKSGVGKVPSRASSLLDAW
jgi:hypothetical protein